MAHLQFKSAAAAFVDGLFGDGSDDDAGNTPQVVEQRPARLGVGAKFVPHAQAVQVNDNNALIKRVKGDKRAKTRRVLDGGDDSDQETKTARTSKGGRKDRSKADDSGSEQGAQDDEDSDDEPVSRASAITKKTPVGKILPATLTVQDATKLMEVSGPKKRKRNKSKGAASATAVSDGPAAPSAPAAVGTATPAATATAVKESAAKVAPPPKPVAPAAAKPAPSSKVNAKAAAPVAVVGVGAAGAASAEPAAPAEDGQIKRKKKKTRSRQKNIKRDTRTLDQLPPHIQKYARQGEQAPRIRPLAASDNGDGAAAAPSAAE